MFVGQCFCESETIETVAGEGVCTRKTFLNFLFIDHNIGSTLAMHVITRGNNDF